jgi:hypothetical protein
MGVRSGSILARLGWVAAAGQLRAITQGYMGVPLSGAGSIPDTRFTLTGQGIVTALLGSVACSWACARGRRPERVRAPGLPGALDNREAFLVHRRES